MEFDKQILNSDESTPLCGSFSKSNQHVCRYRGHGILWYGHGKVMEFCREDFVATLLCIPPTLSSNCHLLDAAFQLCATALACAWYPGHNSATVVGEDPLSLWFQHYQWTFCAANWQIFANFSFSQNVHWLWFWSKAIWSSIYSINWHSRAHRQTDRPALKVNASKASNVSMLSSKSKAKWLAIKIFRLIKIALSVKNTHLVHWQCLIF